MRSLLVVKIGGNILDKAEALDQFLTDFASIEQPKILVHGGGKLATELSNKLGIETQLADGRRITDADTLQVVTMTYAGWINKSVVAKLQAKSCNAIGMSGADAKLFPATKRVVKEIDYGFVGDLNSAIVNTALLSILIAEKVTPVVAPISADAAGQLLNVNADTVARTIAEAMASSFEVKLIYCFEKNGLLRDVNDDASVIRNISFDTAEQLKQEGVITSGMLPKIDNAMGAICNGVNEVVIGHAKDVLSIAKREQGFGTSIKK
jgi:acetylglutamate kinase